MIYEVDFGAMLRGHDITRFTARELCPVGRAQGTARLIAPRCELWANIIPTARLAQEAREHFGRPMVVSSGYRDPVYNRAVGGAAGSLHVQFKALDIYINGVTSKDLAAWFESHRAAPIMGIGTYPTFVHIDTRGTRSRWGMP